MIGPSPSAKRTPINRRRFLTGCATTVTMGLGVLSASSQKSWADRPHLPHVVLDDINAPFGTRMARKILSQDTDTQATTAFHTFPAPWRGGGTAHLPYLRRRGVHH